MKVLLVILLVWMGCMPAAGQSKADRLFERGDYMAAMKLYRSQLEGMGDTKDGKSDQLKVRLGNCFYRLNDVVRAGQMYKSVNQDLLGVEDLSFFAMTLLRSGEYEKAVGMTELVESLGGDPEIVEHVKASSDFAKEVAKQKPLYSANKTNVNFAGFSSGVTYYKGSGIILAAPGMGEDGTTDSRGYKTTRLYNAIFSADGSGGRMMPFADGLADKYHIGAVTFTKDFKRIYYTRTILKKDGSSLLKLMTAEEVNGKWENVTELSINTEDYSYAHPALFRDSLLFFVSDMPGGFGGKDIYVATVQGSECGDVQNLGDGVNTTGDELFPFVDDSGRLYFASNGHVGLGGLDVFVSQQDAAGNWSRPQNMGRPVNSSMDDFGLVFKDTKCTEGFVSSNRGGTGYNDFLFTLKLIPNRTPQKIKIGAPAGDGGGQLAAGENPVSEGAQAVVPKQEMFSVDYRYAIQVGAFRNPVPRVYFEHFKNVKVYLGFDNVYRYTVGEYPDEQLAQTELPQVRALVSDAFVISTDRYVAQKKIRNGLGGDDISDDELLLTRLKNFERMKKERIVPYQAPGKRLERPRNDELNRTSEGYTIVLMSADQVLDASQLEGIDEIDVYSTPDGQSMYCTGLYIDEYSASSQLNNLRRRGFTNARVARTDFNKKLKTSESRRTAANGPSRTDLKDLLDF